MQLIGDFYCCRKRRVRKGELGHGSCNDCWLESSDGQPGICGCGICIDRFKDSQLSSSTFQVPGVLSGDVVSWRNFLGDDFTGINQFQANVVDCGGVRAGQGIMSTHPKCQFLGDFKRCGTENACQLFAIYNTVEKPRVRISICRIAMSYTPRTGCRRAAQRDIFPRGRSGLAWIEQRDRQFCGPLSKRCIGGHPASSLRQSCKDRLE